MSTRRPPPGVIGIWLLALAIGLFGLVGARVIVLTSAMLIVVVAALGALYLLAREAIWQLLYRWPRAYRRATHAWWALRRFVTWAQFWRGPGRWRGWYGQRRGPGVYVKIIAPLDGGTP